LDAIVITRVAADRKLNGRFNRSYQSPVSDVTNKRLIQTPVSRAERRCVASRRASALGFQPVRVLLGGGPAPADAVLTGVSIITS
jgi:hypothetical protein